ncbi:helix-turn-helix domain-containing protein [Microbispora rosea]|uniref:helix-turn-helix domain-containing protein n=1 Tax=Microbispora rosea TaxID=58117 RepID=UPI0037A51AF3
MSGRPLRYVEGALVSGFAAHVVDRLLAKHLPMLLRSTPMSEEQRAALVETRVAVALAADTWAIAAAATPVAAIGSSSPGDEISTAEAAALLGVKERRVRQLAEGGLGRKVGRVWVLDRAAVLAWRDEMRSA